MYDCENVTYPKARKNYLCMWCWELIAKGEQHHYRTGRWGGEWMKERYHPECYDAMRRMAPGEEFVPGEHDRPKKAQ